MGQIRELLNVYNNLKLIKIDVNNENNYINDYHEQQKKQKSFINNLSIIPNQIYHIGLLRKKRKSIIFCINQIVEHCLRIDATYGIANKIISYLPVIELSSTSSSYHIVPENVLNTTTNIIHRFIQKCQNDNLIPTKKTENNDIKNIITNYEKNKHLSTFLYNLQKYFDYYDSSIFHSYEEYYEYILYWLDSDGKNSAHYYKLKTLSI